MDEMNENIEMNEKNGGNKDYQTETHKFISGLHSFFKIPNCDFGMFIRRYRVVCDQDNFLKLKNAVHYVFLRSQNCVIADNSDHLIERLRKDSFTIQLDQGSLLNDFEHFYLNYICKPSLPPNDIESKPKTMTGEKMKDFALELMETFYTRIRSQEDFRILYGFDVEYKHFTTLSRACVFYFVPYRKSQSEAEPYLSYIKTKGFQIVGDIEHPVSPSARGLHDFQTFYRTLQEQQSCL